MRAAKKITQLNKSLLQQAAEDFNDEALSNLNDRADILHNWAIYLLAKGFNQKEIWTKLGELNTQSILTNPIIAEDEELMIVDGTEIIKREHVTQFMVEEAIVRYQKQGREFDVNKYINLITKLNKPKSIKVEKNKPKVDEIPTNNEKTNGKTQKDDVSKAVLAGTAVATPTIAGTILHKRKGYTQIPQEEPESTYAQQHEDIELENIGHNQNGEDELLIEHPESSAGVGTGGAISSGIAGTAAGAAGGAGLTGTQVAFATTAVAGAGIATGLGIVSTKDKNKPKQGYVLPNSDYIGPGNDIHIAPARNKADQIAKDHDIGYDNLIKYAQSNYISEEEFREKVNNLDKTAIDEFSKDYEESGNWQSFVGKYGLKIKTNIEKFINKQIYPTLPGKYTE